MLWPGAGHHPGSRLRQQDFSRLFLGLCSIDPAMNPETIPVITIDGPTASGKGTIAQHVAAALGWHVLDSGALYRLTALAVIRAGADAADQVAAADLAVILDVVFDAGRI